MRREGSSVAYSDSACVNDVIVANSFDAFLRPHAAADDVRGNHGLPVAGESDVGGGRAHASLESGVSNTTYVDDIIQLPTSSMIT